MSSNMFSRSHWKYFRTQNWSLSEREEIEETQQEEDTKMRRKNKEALDPEDEEGKNKEALDPEDEEGKIRRHWIQKMKKDK